MTVLVTGSSGFVGGHLVQELRRRGIAFVDPGRRELGPQTDWRDVLQDVTSVVHLAAMAHERVMSLRGDCESLRNANVLGPEHLARSAAQAGVGHFLFVSTIGVHGEETFEQPFREDSPLEPRSLYATSKAEAEQRLRAVEKDTGLRVTVVRPTLVYGPGNPGNFLRLLRSVHRGWPLPFKSVRNRRSLTYVGNLVDAIVALLEAGDHGDTFIVCDPQPLSTPALIEELAEGMGRAPRLFAAPPGLLALAVRACGRADLARRLLGSLEADTSKLQRERAWRAPHASADGLRQTGAWYRIRREARSAAEG